MTNSDRLLFRGRVAMAFALLFVVGEANAFAFVQEAELGSRIAGVTGTGMVEHITGLSNGPTQVVSQKQSSRIGQEVADCSVAHNPAAIGSYLAGPADEASKSDSFKILHNVVQDCLGGSLMQHNFGASQMELATNLFRGVLAEAEIRRSRKAVAPPAPSVRASYAASWISHDPQDAIVEEMGACLADWRPAESMALLATPPGSQQEHDRLGALMPAVGGCLRKGVTLKASPASLRAAIAMGTYHRMVDAPSAQLADSKKN